MEQIGGGGEIPLHHSLSLFIKVNLAHVCITRCTGWARCSNTARASVARCTGWARCSNRARASVARCTGWARCSAACWAASPTSLCTTRHLTAGTCTARSGDGGARSPSVAAPRWDERSAASARPPPSCCSTPDPRTSPPSAGTELRTSPPSVGTELGASTPSDGTELRTSPPSVLT